MVGGLKAFLKGLKTEGKLESFMTSELSTLNIHNIGR